MREMLVSKAIEKEGRTPRKTWRAKYELIFVVPNDEGLFKNSILETSNGEDALAFTLDIVRGEKEPGPMQYFLDIIDYEKGDHYDHIPYEFLMPDGSFESVYKNQPPPENWRKDWSVNVVWSNSKKNFKLRQTELSEYHVVLFQQDVNVKGSVVLFEGQESHRITNQSSQDKEACQKIAQSEWKTYPGLAIKYMKKHPEIKKICGSTYTQYKEDTVHQWLSEVAPQGVKKPGRISKDNEELQLRMCEKLRIKAS